MNLRTALCAIGLVGFSFAALADDTSPGAAAAAAANNSFAIDAYPKVARAAGNLAFSPYSAESALTMAWLGARAQTARQMADVLHIGRDRAVVAEQFAALRARLVPDDQDESKGSSFRVIVANSIWCQQGAPFKAEFLKVGQVQFGATLSQVDFKNSGDVAGQINGWVAKATSGRIDAVFSPADLDSTTRMVLANAIYFKDRWQNHFPSEKTKDAPFHLSDGASTNVPLMNVTGVFSYGESKTMQVLELPFETGQFSMVIMLPKEIDGVPELERSMNVVDMTQNMSWVKPQDVNVFLPRFKCETRMHLQDALQELGMTDAFSPDFAKFSGMADERLCIGPVVQKCGVEVDENGAEAFSTSALMMMLGLAAQPKPDAFVFRADHPFFFLIRHNQTGAILFMGRVTRP